MTRGLSHTITGTTLPVTDTQSPSVSPAWPRRHRPVSRPHVPGAGPPHAPCHPQSRADTVQTPPLRTPRAAAAPRRRRPVPHPHPGRGPSFPGPGRLWGPPTPQTSSSADACPPRTAGPRVAAGGHAGPGAGGSETRGGPRRGRRRDRTRRRSGARGGGCGIRRADELPRRRGEPGGATRVRIPQAPAASGWVGLRASSLPGRPAAAPVAGSRVNAGPGVYRRPRRLRAF